MKKSAFLSQVVSGLHLESVSAHRPAMFSCGADSYTSHRGCVVLPTGVTCQSEGRRSGWRSWTESPRKPEKAQGGRSCARLPAVTMSELIDVNRLIESEPQQKRWLFPQEADFARVVLPVVL